MMRDKYYTLRYIDGNENHDCPPAAEYQSIQECVDWADKNRIDYYILTISQWECMDGECKIVAEVNLDEPVFDEEREDLSKYMGL